MAPFGVSAGGTLAMNLAYNGNSAIPVRFVFQVAAPTYFEPSEWPLLMKVDKLTSAHDFCKMMTGIETSPVDIEDQILILRPVQSGRNIKVVLVSVLIFVVLAAENRAGQILSQRLYQSFRCTSQQKDPCQCAGKKHQNKYTNVHDIFCFPSHMMLSNSSFPHIAPKTMAAIMIIAITRRSFFCMIAS